MPRTERPKPVPHRGKWRIRWLDEYGERQSESYERQDDAKFALDRHLVQVEEAKRGLRSLAVPKKTFDQLSPGATASMASPR